MWDSSEACFQHLKAAGYHIAATHLAPDSIPIGDLDWTKPTVVIMGNESFGRISTVPRSKALREGHARQQWVVVRLSLPSLFS